MSDLGFNKIAAAVLATALGYMLLKEASHLVIHAEAPAKPAYALAIPETGGNAEAEKPLPFPQADWIAAMDVTKGAKVFKKCSSCHNANDGGANGTGPNLWSIVGASAGAKDGFGYSGAMSSSGFVWDYETLDGFLAKPSKYLKGTNMNFIGLKKPADRAAVIAYLNAQSGSPLPAPVAAVMEQTETVIDAVEGAVMEKAEEIIDQASGSSEN
jgi:cytochrome c